MKTWIRMGIAVLVGLTALNFMACQKAEEAGEETGEAMEEAGEATMEAVEEGAENVEEAAEEAQSNM